jgi:hypothetical protein
MVAGAQQGGNCMDTKYTVVPSLNGAARLIIRSDTLDYWMDFACQAHDELQWVNDRLIDGAILRLFPDGENLLLVGDSTVDLSGLDDEKIQRLVEASLAELVTQSWVLYDGEIYLVVLEPAVAVFTLVDAETFDEYMETHTPDDDGNDDAEE